METIGNKQIKYIYQLADIHIRIDDDRFDEYVDIFKKVGVSMTDENVLTIICGDILHMSKIMHNTPMKLLQILFNTLLEKGDVIMILGNHDISEYGACEMLINAIEISNSNNTNKVHLLSHANIYKYGNLRISTANVRDNNIIRSKYLDNDHVELVNDEYRNNYKKIAVYHGEIHNHIKVSDFKGYDMVMLGDIHKHTIINGHICYSSSLIQQDFGESLYNHGMIKWTIKNNSHEFIKIKNDYGFYTINVKNGVYEQLPTLPKYIKIKIKYMDTDIDSIREIENNIIKKNKDAKIILKNMDDVRNKLDIGKSKVNIENIYKIESQEQIIRELYTNKSTDDVKKLIEYNTKCNNKITYEHTSGKKHIELKEIVFENMFCYADTKNKLVFSNMSGIILVNGNNQTGKSALMDAIIYGIYGKCRRPELNIMRDYYECTVLLRIDGIMYKIYRNWGVYSKSRFKSGNKSSSCEFYKMDECELYEQFNIGLDLTKTNNMIYNLVGSYEDFLQDTVISEYDTNFINSKNGARKTYLCNLFNLNIFNDLKDISTSDLIKISAKYNTMYNKLQKTDYNELIRTKLQIQADIYKYKDDINMLHNDLEKVENEYIELISKMKSIDHINNQSETNINNQYEMNDYVKLSAGISMQIKSKNKQLTQLRSEHHNYDEDTINKIKSDYENLKNNTHVIINDLRDTINELNNEIAINEYKMSDYMSELNTLSTMRFKHACNKCNTNKDIVDEMRANIESTNRPLESATNYTILDKKYKQQELDDITKKIYDRYDAYIKQMLLEKEINILQTEQNKIERKISDVKIIVKSNQTLIQLEQLKRNRISIKDNINNHTEQLFAHNNDLGNVQNKINKYEETHEKYDKISKEMHVIEQYNEIMSSGTLTSFIFGYILGVVQAKVNEILTIFSNIYIQLSNDKKDICIKYVHMDKTHDIAGACASEKAMINLAFKIAFSQMSHRRYNFFIIDEAFEKYDTHAIGNINKFFDYIKEQYDFIFIITHDIDVKKHLNHEITITKDKHSYIT
jgi:DNA repair exonuclease SbcCD ATPase subunit